MVSIASRSVPDKFQALGLLDEATVERICRERQYQWNAGKLTPAKTLECMGWQVLMGNVSLGAVVQHYDCLFTASALCQGRDRLALGVVEDASHWVCRRVLEETGHARRPEPRPGFEASPEHAGKHGSGKQDGSDRPEPGRYKGKRVFRIDGTGTTLPDSPEVRRYFGCSGSQKPGCGLPTAHVLVLTGPGGVAMDAICSPLRTGDMTHAAKTHAHLEKGDLLMGDGLFCGVCHLHRLMDQRLDGLFPAHHSRKIAFGKNADHGKSRRFVKTLGFRDQLVEYAKPDRRPKWMTAAEFKAMAAWTLVREIRREVKVGGVRREITVVTTLLDPAAYPAGELVKLLGERWDIELDLRSLKTTMGMESLKCQSVEGVKKELLVYLIVYNLVKLLIHLAARCQDVALARVSFADALAALRYGQGRPESIALNRHRPGRIEPRVVKRRRKAFAVMTKPRDTLRKLLLQKRKKAARKS